MKIVSTFHQPSSVIGSLKTRLASAELEHLVIAKLNRLDVFSLQPEGLKHECSLEIWGKVLSVKAIPISGSMRSNLIVMLDHPDPALLFLTYTESTAGTGELTVKKEITLYERLPRSAEFCNDVFVDPTGTLAAASCYAGKLKVVRLKAGSWEQDFDILLPELSVLAMTFLPTSSQDTRTLAIMHIDHEQRIQLLSRDIVNILDVPELAPSPSLVLPSTPIPSKSFPLLSDSPPFLIPVPPTSDDLAGLPEGDNGFLGGVIVVGGKKLLLYELASEAWQEKQQGKKRRLERQKGVGEKEALKAKEKEKEIEGKKRKTRAAVDWPWSDVTAWCAIDECSTRYLLGDAFGRLSMLSLDSLDEHGLVLLPLGETSPSTSLTYLTSQILYLGSHMGNSQLLRINPAPISDVDIPTLPIPPSITAVPPARLVSSAKGKEKAVNADDMDIVDDEGVKNKDKTKKGCVIQNNGVFLSVLETYKNIAPIMDAISVDVDGTGQPQIVTCSGGRNTGSINVIRTGADFQQLATINGLSDIASIWPIRALYEDSMYTHVLTSTLKNSHIFRIDGQTTFTRIEQTGKGFITDTPTLALSNFRKRVLVGKTSSYLNSSFVVQVTPKGVYLLDYDLPLGEYAQVGRPWTPDNFLEGDGGVRSRETLEIVAASINASQIAVALNGGRLAIIVLNERDELSLSKKTTLKDNSSEVAEISAVSCMPMNESKPWSLHIVVSYWGSNRIEVLSNGDGFTSSCKSPPLPALVRSLLFYNFGQDQEPKGSEYHPYVLAGLADGSVVSLSFKNKQLRDQKIFSLGNLPVSLTACTVDDKRAVFAAGSRATVLYLDKQRLQHSPILLKDTVTAAKFQTSHYHNSFLLATPTGLSIGNVRDLDKMHIRSVPLGLDNPRNIAHYAPLKVFGVTCTRTDPTRIGDPPSFSSSFRLLDDTSFNHLTQFNCDSDEEITALTIIPQINITSVPLFCLGTMVYQADEREPAEGRLLILDARSVNGQSRSTNLQLSLVTSLNLKGCVYSLTIINGLIAAAVNASVSLFHLDRTDDQSAPTYTLQKVAEWNHNYIVTSLVSIGDHLFVGDNISSVSVLKVVDSKLQTVARDYGPLWPIAIEALNENTVIGATNDLNLFTFSLQRTLNRSVLERDGSYHIGEMVTKFIRGALTSHDDSSGIPLEAKQIVFTSSGRIAVVVDITNDQLALDLTALQRNLSRVIRNPGEVSHTRFRAPKTRIGKSDADAASFGFLDGDFLEQLLGRLSSPDDIKKIWAGQSEPERLIISLERAQEVLETLQSMH